MLDYKLIEALARVIEDGGFKRAAQVLCLTQSAVSQRIRQLEERCGCVLLTRGSPPRPTAAGSELIKHYRQVRLLEESLDTRPQGGPTILPVGINTDSLASWFFTAIRPLLAEDLLFDLRVDDQERTHTLLRTGEVVGCVSAERSAIKGCRVVALGAIVYRLLATKAFGEHWFPDGLTPEAVERAPAVVYNDRDRLHHGFLERLWGRSPANMPAHSIPRPEQLYQMISEGFAYGMVPDWQSAAARRSGDLVDLRPAECYPVQLYWHCWNMDSEPLRRLSDRIVAAAAEALAS